ncbi:Transcription factor [Akanthomyces lecanii RCEF 1005]|uniref:Transcription factor n=1 Tax=Akanthomyces lecanii RCEF 1005 TaxID=1081108 RepID=A0A168GM23_CORDF|nr:Transcription factor [Akanthomyces lecanii RCEF 1005]
MGEQCFESAFADHFWDSNPGEFSMSTDRSSQKHISALHAERVLEGATGDSNENRQPYEHAGNTPGQACLSYNIRSGMSSGNFNIANVCVLQPTAMTRKNQEGDGALPFDGELCAIGDASLSCPWKISASQYEAIRAQVSTHSGILPLGFTIPTRHTLSRFLEGYFRGFHEHLPFLHTTTFSVSELPAGLLLSMTAVGALYKYEQDMGYTIYFAAKAITNYNLRTQRECSATTPNQADQGDSTICEVEQKATSAKACPHAEQNIGQEMGGQRGLQEAKKAPETSLRTMQALVILTAMSTWGRGDLVSDSLESASQVAVLLRTNGLSSSDCITGNVNWEEWIGIEERRRTLFAGFSLLSLQSVAFNVPPPLMNREVMLSLPHPMEMWRAETEAKWNRVKSERTHKEATFASILGTMLRRFEINSASTVSAFGNYILIHGLVQQIFLQRQCIDLDLTEKCFEQATLDRMDKALRSWQHCWSVAPESTLDPLSRNGPVAFNSTALLRIAYIRLTVDLGTYRSVMTRNPACLAKSVYGGTGMNLARSPSTDLAMLQCTRALGIIVKKGIAFNLATLVQAEGESALRSEERKLLGMIATFVNETLYASQVQEDSEASGRIRSSLQF